MPKILNNMENVKLPGSNYVYSMTKKDNLTSAEYTLVSVAVDVSGSVLNFSKELENCLKEVVNSCKLSPRADNLLVRVVKFGSDVVEHHGFKLLSEINLDDYNDFYDSYNGSRATALYDANVDSLEALGDSGSRLTKDDYTVNSIHFCITDGVDYQGSTYGPEKVAELQTKIKQGEMVESLLSILVKVNVTDSLCSSKLDEFKDKGKFDQVIDVGDANSKNMAKLAKFVSKSISSQSKSLGSNNASQTLNF
jgi:uncharacterized protein YegL